ncbi:MAG: ABC transporter permease [Bacteroidota bacterium]
MFKNNLKIAWRNLVKDRQFTFLNLIGLSTGLACTLFIYLWVQDERSVDHFHQNGSRLYQVMVNVKNSGGVQTIPQTPALLADAIEREIPEAEMTVATQNSFSGKFSLTAGEQHIKAIGVYAGKSFFSMFSWHLQAGDESKLLSDKNSIVISKNLAVKLFRNADNAMGQRIGWISGKQNIVTGVFDGPPANSSVQFDFVLPFELFLDANDYEKDWNNSDPNTFVLLRKGASVAGFTKKLEGVINSKTKNKASVFIRPYSSGYLYDKYENGKISGGRIEYVRLFSIIAIFILVIACINFMNLATAKASKRMKEVGIKKVVGASRQSLIFQYLTESCLIAFMSVALALLLVALFLPAFNILTGKSMILQGSSELISAVLLIALLTGLLSGSYPALYLSGFKPIAVLKGKLQNAAGEIWIRKGLVIFQFTLAVVFIVSALVVYQQIVFIQTKNQGFDKDHVISFRTEDLSGDNIEKYVSSIQTFLAEVKKVPGVINASSMDHGSIISDFGSTGDIHWEGKMPGNNISFGNIGVNYGLIETLGMKMKEGRSFSRSVSSDSSEIIFNEAAIQAMGLKDPVGKTVKMWGANRKIAGVVQDFHFQSMHENVKPFAMRLEPAFTDCILAKIKADNEASIIKKIQQLYQQYYPGYPLEYTFLDQDYQAQYQAENRIAVLSKYFTALTILISCLGLFGLAAFTAERRMKEIGIRKVLGATVSSVIVLLSADFLKLILIAVLIAFPIAWWATNSWLNGFAYHINIDITVFLVAGFATFLITILTISFQATKAALKNPVKSLRSE